MIWTAPGNRNYESWQTLSKDCLSTRFRTPCHATADYFGQQWDTLLFGPFCFNCLKKESVPFLSLVDERRSG